MRISDWSSDVCSSDLVSVSATPGTWEMDRTQGVFAEQVIRPTGLIDPPVEIKPVEEQVDDLIVEAKKTAAEGERKSVVEGKSVAVRVYLGGGRLIKKKKQLKQKDL